LLLAAPIPLFGAVSVNTGYLLCNNTMQIWFECLVFVMAKVGFKRLMRIWTSGAEFCLSASLRKQSSVMFTGRASIVASALDGNMVKPVARIAEAHFAWNG
jgi:hypothetical protein